MKLTPQQLQNWKKLRKAKDYTEQLFADKLISLQEFKQFYAAGTSDSSPLLTLQWHKEIEDMDADDIRSLQTLFAQKQSRLKRRLKLLGQR